MAYDAKVESTALIESRILTPVPRLSRRRRFVGMAVDVAGDLAATMFLHRGSDCAHQEIHVLSRHDGQWHILGGSSISPADDENLLADRPGLVPEALQLPRNILSGIDPQVMVAAGSVGQTSYRMNRVGFWPWHRRWISYFTALASARVESVRIGNREIVVPWHGRVLIVWAGRGSPKLAAYDVNGSCLGSARIPN